MCCCWAVVVSLRRFGGGLQLGAGRGGEWDEEMVPIVGKVYSVRNLLTIEDNRKVMVNDMI